VDALDRLFLERACELAERGIGSTSPNPPVGAVVVAAGRIAGEGFHHRAGDLHAEIEALRAAGEAAKGATLYVTLEPCNHHGRTPPCTQAIAAAGITRVVAGTLDPNPRTAAGGVAFLRDRGIAVEIADDGHARTIVEPFARSIGDDRPYVTLKMAMSMDGYVAADSGTSQWLTGEEAREFVRELRIAHDAVAVGARTVRIDNPQLTVRPPHHRLLPYRRVVACETNPVDPQSAIFAPFQGYGRTVVLAPRGVADRFAALHAVADVLFLGSAEACRLDAAAAFHALRRIGITSMLCEGGPTFAGRLLAEGLVDQLVWLVAPLLLASPRAVPVVSGAALSDLRGLRVDCVERLGRDMMIAGSFERADV
jgi:diaminohydroxyphosphoribosylaminopyrimidine deaminase/5-amino-6-(5-phosphoribosylamino)uracil reductase